jgi:uncharacterized protein
VQIYLPIAELSVSIFLILGMSTAVGFISGLFGVGGGFLMTPLLVFLGIPPNVSVATGAAQIVASSTTGVLNFWRKKNVDFKLGLVLVSGGLVGTLLGVLFFNAMRRAGYFEIVLVMSYIILLGSVGGLMLIESLKSIFQARRQPTESPKKSDARWWFETLPLPMKFERSQLAISVIPVVALGTFIGFAGAVLGIGGGFMVVPALIYFFRVPTSVVVGTSLFQILVTMTFATILHAITNQSVDIVLALILIIGSVIGAQFGTRAGQNLKGEHFRFLLALLVFGVALRFAAEAIGKPTEVFSVETSERAR